MTAHAAKHDLQWRIGTYGESENNTGNYRQRERNPE